MQIQISWLLQKPTDLDLHCLQKQDISGFSRTWVKCRVAYKVSTYFIMVPSSCFFFVFCFFSIIIIFLITKTRLYSFDPLKPHFYIVKLGFIGVYIIFLISAKKHGLWVLVRTEAVLTSTHNLRFEQKYEKCQSFLCEYFQFLEVKFSIYLNMHVFVMLWSLSPFCISKMHPVNIWSDCANAQAVRAVWCKSSLGHTTKYTFPEVEAYINL